MKQIVSISLLLCIGLSTYAQTMDMHRQRVADLQAQLVAAESRIPSLEAQSRNQTIWAWSSVLLGALSYSAFSNSLTPPDSGAFPPHAPAFQAGSGAVTLGFSVSSVWAFVSRYRTRSAIRSTSNEIKRLGRQIETSESIIADIERRQRLADRYDERTIRAINGQQIFIGMDRGAVLESWGTPDDINRTTTGRGTSEQLVYRRGSARYVYIDNGVVTAIQD